MCVQTRTAGNGQLPLRDRNSGEPAMGISPDNDRGDAREKMRPNHCTRLYNIGFLSGRGAHCSHPSVAVRSISFLTYQRYYSRYPPSTLNSRIMRLMEQTVRRQGQRFRELEERITRASARDEAGSNPWQARNRREILVEFADPWCSKGI